MTRSEWETRLQQQGFVQQYKCHFKKIWLDFYWTKGNDSENSLFMNSNGSKGVAENSDNHYNRSKVLIHLFPKWFEWFENDTK